MKVLGRKEIHKEMMFLERDLGLVIWETNLNNYHNSGHALGSAALLAKNENNLFVIITASTRGSSTNLVPIILIRFQRKKRYLFQIEAYEEEIYDARNEGSKDGEGTDAVRIGRAGYDTC